MRPRYLVLFVVIVAAFALGAVGLYAHERPVRLVGGCPSGYVSVLGVDRETHCLGAVSNGGFGGTTGQRPEPTYVPVTDANKGGALGSDSAPFWGYGALAVLVIGGFAAFALIPNRVRDDFDKESG